MIGRAHHVVIDGPDPAGLAAFYSELLGLPVTYVSADFVVIAENDTTSGFAFQLAPDHVAPRWPGSSEAPGPPVGARRTAAIQRVPQQFHLDVMVDDFEVADEAVRALGARPVAEGDHVYLDPAGHPFCLIPRPGWAPPIHPG
jgi:catechol 2,3-dioxygenase-like lactoylglutathione lyase family enzyme